MTLSLLPLLDKLEEEVCLEECLDRFICEDSSVGTKISTLFVLAKKYGSSNDLELETADKVLKAFPTELVEELLHIEEPDWLDYQKLLVNIYTKLLSVSSDEVYEKHLDTVKSLFRFMKNKSVELCLPFESFTFLIRAPIRNDQKMVHDGLRMLITYLDGSVDNPWPLSLLDMCTGLVMLLTDLPEDSLFDWEDDFRILVGKILKVPPNRLQDEYKLAALCLADAVSAKRGCIWFQKDCQLLCLIAHLTTAELRIVLDKPDINYDSLIVCIDLLEMAIRAVDDEDFMNDDDALKVSRAIQDASAFIVGYWVGAQSVEEEKEKINDAIDELFYRYLCNLFSYGGQIFVEPEQIKSVTPLMVQVFKKECINKDTVMAGALIRVLDCIKYGVETPLLIKEFLCLSDTETADQHIIDEVIEVISKLISQCDWYNKTTLDELIVYASKFKNEPKLKKALKIV